MPVLQEQKTGEEQTLQRVFCAARAFNIALIMRRSEQFAF